MEEEYHPLKLYYFILQVLLLVKTNLLSKKIDNSCLTLRCFSISKVSLEIKMTNFAFARPSTGDDKQIDGKRGGVSGYENDQQALIGLLEELTLLRKLNSSETKLFICTIVEAI